MLRRLTQIAALVVVLAGQALALPVDQVLAASKAKVAVKISVTQFAEVEFPNGTNFVLRVPNIPHCAPYRDRDWDYNHGGHGNGWGGSSNNNNNNHHNDWDDWRDDDWNRWSDNGWWDDWDDWNGNDWHHDTGTVAASAG